MYIKKNRKYWFVVYDYFLKQCNVWLLLLYSLIDWGKGEKGNVCENERWTVGYTLGRWRRKEQIRWPKSFLKKRSRLTKVTLGFGGKLAGTGWVSYILHARMASNSTGSTRLDSHAFLSLFSFYLLERSRGSKRDQICSDAAPNNSASLSLSRLRSTTRRSPPQLNIISLHFPLSFLWSLIHNHHNSPPKLNFESSLLSRDPSLSLLGYAQFPIFHFHAALYLFTLTLRNVRYCVNYYFIFSQWPDSRWRLVMITWTGVLIIITTELTKVHPPCILPPTSTCKHYRLQVDDTITDH